MTDFHACLERALSGTPLTAEEMAAAMGLMLEGKANHLQMAAFLAALRVRGESVEEIEAAARAMRARAVKVEAPDNVIDTCGTGGDGAGTYNISTAVSFVAAGAGAKVAKHGNKAASSKSGAADVLSALGVNILASPAQITRCIEKAGVGFMFAATHHQSMANIAPVRKELKVRTLFNCLGPLTNPAGATRQLMGVYDRALVDPIAHVLKRLGSCNAMVVHGSDGLDELTTTGDSTIAWLKNGSITTMQVSPADFGLALASEKELQGGTPEENADALRAVLGGSPSPYADIVLFNAAAALCVADLAEDLGGGLEQARQSIASGAAEAALAALVHYSNEDIA